MTHSVSEIKGLNCDQLCKILKEQNVSDPVLEAIQDSRYSGADFVDESFPEDAMDDDAISKFHIKKLHLKTLTRVHKELTTGTGSAATASVTSSPNTNEKEPSPSEPSTSTSSPTAAAASSSPPTSATCAAGGSSAAGDAENENKPEGENQAEEESQLELEEEEEEEEEEKKPRKKYHADIPEFWIQKLLGEDDCPFDRELKDQITDALDSYDDLFKISKEDLMKKSGVCSGDAELVDVTRQVLVKEGWDKITGFPVDNDFCLRLFVLGDNEANDSKDEEELAVALLSSSEERTAILDSLEKHMDKHPQFLATLAKVETSVDLTTRRFCQLFTNIFSCAAEYQISGLFESPGFLSSLLERFQASAQHVSSGTTAFFFASALEAFLGIKCEGGAEAPAAKQAAIDEVLKTEKFAQKVAGLSAEFAKSQRAIYTIVPHVASAYLDSENKQSSENWVSAEVANLLAVCGNALNESPAAVSKKNKKEEAAEAATAAATRQIAKTASSFLGALAALCKKDKEKGTDLVKTTSALKSAYEKCKPLATAGGKKDEDVAVIDKFYS